MFCDRTKEFLSQRNIAFAEKNIATDPVALDELETLGFMTTPVTVIDGETVVGFDKEKLERLLSA